MLNQTSPRRSSLENRAHRLGLTLSEAGRHARAAAAGQNEPLPRWELSDGKYQGSIRGYRSLKEVALALLGHEINAET